MMKTIKVFQTTTHQAYAKNVLAAFNMDVFTTIEEMRKVYECTDTKEDQSILDTLYAEMSPDDNPKELAYPLGIGDVVCIDDAMYRCTMSGWLNSVESACLH